MEPTFVDHEGDDASALALAISLNVQRRDLTAAQRAIVAAKSMPMFEEAGLARMKTGKSTDGEAGGRGKKAKPLGGSHPRVSSAEQAGKTFKVGEQSVKQAKAILAESPDLASQVEGCTPCGAIDSNVKLTPVFSPRQGRVSAPGCSHRHAIITQPSRQASP